MFIFKKKNSPSAIGTEDVKRHLRDEGTVTPAMRMIKSYDRSLRKMNLVDFRGLFFVLLGGIAICFAVLAREVVRGRREAVAEGMRATRARAQAMLARANKAKVQAMLARSYTAMKELFERIM